MIPVQNGFPETILNQSIRIIILNYPFKNVLMTHVRLLRIELHSFERRVEVLISSASECDLSWKYSLYRGNQFKMESLQWSLIPYD